MLLIIFIFLGNDCFGKKIKGFDPYTGCVLLPDDWDIKKDFVDENDCRRCVVNCRLLNTDAYCRKCCNCSNLEGY